MGNMTINLSSSRRSAARARAKCILMNVRHIVPKVYDVTHMKLSRARRHSEPLGRIETEVQIITTGCESCCLKPVPSACTLQISRHVMRVLTVRDRRIILGAVTVFPFSSHFLTLELGTQGRRLYNMASQRKKLSNTGKIQTV